MKSASFISQNHPSFGTAQAYFMFTMRVQGAITRLFVVEARNPWAVQCMERLLGTDQRVSDTCECAAIFRGKNVGIRGEICEEIEYIDFFMDIVDATRMMDDSLTIEAFQRSLTDADRAHLNARSTRAPSNPSVAPPASLRIPACPKVPTFDGPKGKATPDKESPEYAKVLGVICGLGFKRNQVEPLMDEVDLTEETSKSVQKVLQRLAS